MTIEKLTYRDPRPEELDENGLLIGEDTRNVADQYKRVPMEMIRESLDEKRSSLVNIISNYTNDFNKATIIRSSNAFLADSIYVIGKRRFDRRGTVGAHHTEHIYYGTEFDEVIDDLHQRGYKVFAVDNTPHMNPVNVWDVEMPEKSAFVYGEEGRSLDEATVAKCDQSIYIHQAGSVRSLNVAVAASIIMAEYSRRHSR